VAAGPRTTVKINYEIGINSAHAISKQAKIRDPSSLVSSSRKTLNSKEGTLTNTDCGRINTENGLTENTFKPKILNRNKTGSISSMATANNLNRENRLSR
jgi:hypothetical protein